VTASPLSPLTAQIQPAGGGSYLTVCFQRLSGATNLVYTLESAGDLCAASWTFLAGGTNGAPLSGPGLVGETPSTTAGLADVTVRDIVPVGDASERFLRLQITK
jgi:hypothetical protein